MTAGRMRIRPFPFWASLFQLGGEAGGLDVKNLTDPSWIKAKGILFLLLGLLAASLVAAERPTLKTVALLALAIWSFCRFYYFCFYVLERFVDPGYRYSGIWSAIRYLSGKR